jgi:hypothetical protein
MLWTSVALAGLTNSLPKRGSLLGGEENSQSSASAARHHLGGSVSLTATMDCEPPPDENDSGGNGSTLSSSHQPQATSGGSPGGSSIGACVGVAPLPTRELLEDRGGYLMRVLALLVADGSLAVRAHPRCCVMQRVGGLT